MYPVYSDDLNGFIFHRMIFHLRWLAECGMSRKEYSTVYHRSFTHETKNQCLALPVPTVPIVLDRLIVLGNLTSDQPLSKKKQDINVSCIY